MPGNYRWILSSIVVNPSLESFFYGDETVSMTTANEARLKRQTPTYRDTSLTKKMMVAISNKNKKNIQIQCFNGQKWNIN